MGSFRKFKYFENKMLLDRGISHLIKTLHLNMKIVENLPYRIFYFT